MVELSDGAFWDSYHQRDLLLVVAKRWQDLFEQTRKEIESRFLEGPARWDGEDDAEWKTRKAWASVNRLHWLADKGCEFTFDLAAESMKLRRIATEWRPEYAAKAADSMESRGG